jgi:hypothetical protein
MKNHSSDLNAARPSSSFFSFFVNAAHSFDVFPLFFFNAGQGAWGAAA